MSSKRASNRVRNGRQIEFETDVKSRSKRASVQTLHPPRIFNFLGPAPPRKLLKDLRKKYHILHHIRKSVTLGRHQDQDKRGELSASDIRRVLRAFLGRFDTSAGDRSDRSRDRSIESIDSIDSIIFWIFGFFGHVGEVEICLVSKSQLCTTLGGRKNGEKPKRKNLDFLASSIRSIR